MEIRTPADLAGTVREARRALGWTQQQLANRAGVSRVWIVQLEHGKETAHIGLVLRVLGELGVRLRGGSTPPSRPSPPERRREAEAVIGEVHFPRLEDKLL